MVPTGMCEKRHPTTLSLINNDIGSSGKKAEIELTSVCHPSDVWCKSSVVVLLGSDVDGRW